jgi:hypothetical protein
LLIVRSLIESGRALKGRSELTIKFTRRAGCKELDPSKST